ncbi:MAG: LysM peptidoglycan-binding domain-containing protein [Bacillota bacterium]
MNLQKVYITLIILALSTLMAGSCAFAANYTVKPGDSLYLIAKRYGLSPETIRKANNLPGTRIYPGQVLYIPTDTWYTVKRGDSLFKIGQRFGVSYQEIARANGLNMSKPIYPGQVLRIPQSGQTSRGGTRPYVIPCSPAEFDLLARLITAEAGGEPYNAQVGVGAVIVNRVLSTKFPNSISGVIYEVNDGHYQFTPVLNGWINRPATSRAFAAATDALRGVDPSWNALYFYAPPIKNKFLLARPVTTKIGGLVFTR